VISFSYWSIKLCFHTEGILTAVLIIPSSWCFPTSPVRHQRRIAVPRLSSRRCKVTTAAPAFAGAGISIVRAGRPRATIGVAGWGRHSGRLGGAGQGEPRGSPSCRGIGSPTAGCNSYPNLSDEKRGATPLWGRIALHITRQLLKTRFPKLVRRSPRHWRERGEGANGGQGFPRLFTPWGARLGRLVTTVLPLAPPSSLVELASALTTHRALSWVRGEACAPLASSRPAAPPSPLRGSAAVESLPPLCWGEAASGLGDGASTTPARARQRHASPPPERAALPKQRGGAPTFPRRARRPGRLHRLLPQTWPKGMERWSCR
jgi:hypothetical protein